MKKVRKVLALVVAFCLALPCSAGMTVSAADTGTEEKVELTKKISHKEFTFAPDKWEAGDDAHTWSKTVDTSNPSATWYEVKFKGHKIDIYSGKNHPMGKVKYFIDGDEKDTFSLYNASNINSTLIVTYDNLGEGEHTFRAEATGEKDTSSTNNLIDAAEVVVYYYPTVLEGDIHGSIVESGLQYTQSSYESIVEKDVTEESLSAWKNDTAVSQISLVTGAKALKNVKVAVSDFTKTGGAKIAKDHVTATFIKSVQAYTGMPGYGSTTRPIPSGSREEANEVLYQQDPIDMGATAVQNVWLSIEVPKDAEEGTYTGTVTVSADGTDETETFHYTLDVADAVLADAIQFKDGFDIELWQNPYIVAEYYGVDPFSEEHLKILTPHMEKYKSIGGHAITTTIVDDAWAGQTYSSHTVKYPSMIKWTKKKDGKYTFSYDDFDKWIEFNKKLGIGDKIVCYSIAPWNSKITYYDEATKSEKAITYTVGDSNYTSMWTAFLQDLMTHMEAKGWKDQTYIGIDERGFDVKAFDLIDSIKGTDGQPFKTAGAMDGFVTKRDMAMRVDDLNVGSIAVKAHPAEFEELRQAREDAGLRTTVYTCTGHIPGSFSLSAPSECYWIMMYAYSVGGEGFLKWAYDSWVENPLEDTTHNAFEAGDCFLIFPDKKEAENPVSKSSLRLEKMAEGVRDVNKLLQMEREIPALEDEVDAIMDTVKPSYPSTTYYLTDASKVTLAEDMDTIKEKIADLTEEYIEMKRKGTDKVESVRIEEGGSTTVSLGASKELHAVFTPGNLLNTNVVWSSDNEDVVRVSKKGVITGNMVGTAVITAVSQQDPSKKAAITVQVQRVTVDEAAQVSYYSFDDENASTVADAWGNRSGTITGASYADGKSGKAIKIQSGSKVTFPANTTLTQEWTVGYWVYNEGTPSSRVSVLTSSDGARSFDNAISESNLKGGVHVSAGSGGYLTFSTYQAAPDEWVHLTWTNSKSAGLALYINGEEAETNAWTKTNDFTAPVDVLGGQGFAGLVDELKIYNRALTAAEVRASMQMEGLNISQTSVNLKVGETYTISYDLISDKEDKTVTFTSSDPEIVKVSDKGVVSALKKGTAVITVENEAGGYRQEIMVTVTKDLEIQYTIPQYVLPEENLSDIEKAPNTDRQYLGQPDMIMLDDNQTLITAYPIGHGCGPLVMKVSKDGGETWTEKTDIPASWANSLETPTMYKLNMTDGTTKLILITGRPNWHGNTTGGWQTSISTDNGKTWSEYQTFQSTFKNGNTNWTIVAMASLVQLKDEEGNFIDKWMGVYHDYNYVNYRTYLTFDENGNEQWTEPEPYLSEYRSIESTYQICEVGMFRSPDGKRIVGLARAQSHQNKSVMFYSDDEGKTWSQPEDMQGALQGERHKVVYDPISGRLVITFREIILDYNKNGQIENNDWMAGDWIAWVGTYEDLMEQNEGQYRILLDEDWANNAKSGDTGYAGIIVRPDGTFVMDSYGHWDKEFSLSWAGGVTTDLCYIRQAKFTLGELEQLWGLVDKAALQAKVEQWKDLNENDYDVAAFELFTKALEKAEAVLSNSQSQQVQIDAAEAELEEAYNNLNKHLVIELPFIDVQPGDWYYDTVEDVYLKGYMTGMTKTVFGSGNNLARAQFATILWRMEGEPQVQYDPSKFADVADGQFYTQAVLWAAEKGIVSGYSNSGLFGPGDNITREQMAVMMYRYAVYKKYDVSASQELGTFPDANMVQKFAQDAMRWCTAMEIITGDKGMLNPQGNTNRAVCATIISRFVNAYEQ